MATSFNDIYTIFFSNITDDMYIELTKKETEADCGLLLTAAVPKFEFPKKSLAYDLDTAEFIADLDMDEKNILALLMVQGWLQRQINSIENTAQKYYGNSFKLTSQASHLAKLIDLKKSVHQECFHLQRLYKRRKVDLEGNVLTSWSMFNTYNG